MAETGLAEIIETVSTGVAEMLTGKKFPMNIRVNADEVNADEFLSGNIS